MVALARELNLGWDESDGTPWFGPLRPQWPPAEEVVQKMARYVCSCLYLCLRLSGSRKHTQDN